MGSSTSTASIPALTPGQKENPHSTSPNTLFSEGSDLLYPDGLTPWKIPLIHSFRTETGLRRLLLSDGFITSADEAEIERLVSGIGGGLVIPLLEDIRAPFLFSMANCLPNVYILQEESIFWGHIRFNFDSLGFKTKRGPTGTRSGKAMVRFEVMNRRDVRAITAKDDVVVLRVLGIIEPPKPEDAEIASQIYKEGELVQRYNVLSGATMGPWFLKDGPDQIIPPSSMKKLKETYLSSGHAE